MPETDKTAANERAANEQGSAPDLQALLNEYEQDDASKGTDPAKGAGSDAAPDVRKLAQEVEEIRRIAAERESRQALDTLVNNIRESAEELTSVDPMLIEDALHGMARRDPRIAKAFMEREAKPSAWAGVQRELGKQLAEKFGSLNTRKATENTRAAAAGARGISTTQPNKDDAGFDRGAVAKMSDAEFNRFKAEFLAGRT